MQTRSTGPAVRDPSASTGAAPRLRRNGVSCRRPVPRGPLAAIVLLAGLTAVTSLSASPYRLLGGVASGGGGHSQSQRFAIEGTTGQPATQQSVPGGNRFTIESGFWAFAPAASGQLLSDGFEP